MFIQASIFLFAHVVVHVSTVQWDNDNDPSTWSRSFEYKLDKLPRQGQVKKMPWNDDYWASNRGGIANRWQASGSPGFNYKLATLSHLQSGSFDINLLSPAEKYDILQSRYDYPLVHSEWSRVSPDDPEWEGLCHGWAAAAIVYDEPNNVTMVNKDGLTIPFVSSDVKALLSYFMGQFAQGKEKSSFIGNRCDYDLEERPNKASKSECWDVNPGTFHVMLANLVGNKGKSFVADVDRGVEVWNHPIVKYEYSLGKTRKPSRKSAPGTVETRQVSFVLHYSEITDASAKAEPPSVEKTQYDYVLDLNADREILGGAYLKDQWDRVDFMWDSDAPEFFGYFTELREIYDRATRSNLLRSPPRRRHRVTLADYKAEIVEKDVIKLSSYNETTERAWLIPNRSSRKSLRLKFTSFNTCRQTEFVRIFEVKNEEIHAPLAVLHGNALPKRFIEIGPGVSALVTFSVERMATRLMKSPYGTGFTLEIVR